MMKATLKALKEFKININMRCIEMAGDNLWQIVARRININMRCIEI